MMLFYEIQNGRTSYNRVRIKDLIVNTDYSVSDLVVRETFGDTEYSYFIECRFPAKEAKLMTDDHGRKPFAVATHDSPNDTTFRYFELSKILVRPGYHFIYSYIENVDGPLTILVFRVNDISDIPHATLIHKFNSDAEIPNNFIDSTRHLLKIFNTYQEDYLIPKYCYNPGRYITFRLFHRDSTDNLVSYLHAEKQLIVNKKSPLYLRPKEKVPYNNIIARCFFSQKYKDNKYTLVDGYPLEALIERDVEDYIEKSNISKSVAEMYLKKAYTRHHDEAFYVITNGKGEVRPIYKTPLGYSSFALNEFELRFIDRMEPVVR